MRSSKWFYLLYFVFCSSYAAEPEKFLPDTQQEARAHALFQELRCVVCESQSIADSKAELAQDMRVLIRERISTGETDASIRTYLVSRYGKHILMKPPLEASTALLWFGPIAILGMGAMFLFTMVARKSRP